MEWIKGLFGAFALAHAAGNQEVDEDGNGSSEENHPSEPPAEAVALFVAVEAGLAAGGPLVGSPNAR